MKAVARDRDAMEREADEMGDAVAALPPSMHAGTFLHPVGGRVAAPAGLPSTVARVISSDGEKLATDLRSRMESGFARDFSSVRIHRDEAAARAAQEMSARAFTVGRDVVFGRREFAPESFAGRKLIAHELTHVVQQAEKPAHPQLQRAPQGAGGAGGGAGGYSGAAELESTMLALFERLSPETVATLVRNKTIAIGWVSRPDGVFAQVFTVSNNWINADLDQATKEMGLLRWDTEPELSGPRALTGAAADAEQLLEGRAVKEQMRVEALAVSRPVCEHCALAIKHHHRGDVLVVEVDIPAPTPRGSGATSVRVPRPEVDVEGPHSGRSKGSGAKGGGSKGGGWRSALGAVDFSYVDWAIQHREKGFIELGTFADGRRIAVGPGGLGEVETKSKTLSNEMRMLTPEEAERTLPAGAYFVNRSGPVTSKLSPMLMEAGMYEWFELWEVEYSGHASYTGCRTPSGSPKGMHTWDEAALRAVWNTMNFRCPARNEPDKV